MNQNRIFLIPEAIYDRRADDMRSLYSIATTLIEGTHILAELLPKGEVSQDRANALHRYCYIFQKIADSKAESFGLPAKFVRSRDIADLEPMKEKEALMDAADDDDDLDDFEDFCDFCEDCAADEGVRLEYVDIQRICDKLYELKEDATSDIVEAASVIEDADELIESLEKIMYRMNY